MSIIMIQPRQELPTNVVHYYRKIKTSLLLNILLCLSWAPHWWWLPPVVSGVALMWSLQTDEYKLHSGARLQAGKRQAKTKEQFVAQVGGWCCSRQQGQQITAAGLPWPHLCPQMRWRWTTALINIQLMKQLAFMKLVGLFVVSWETLKINVKHQH